MDDLARATEKLGDFVAATASGPAFALGYSNGANILAAVLFQRPELFARSVLMHPLIPFTPPPQPALAGHRVLITAGRHDPICPPESTLVLERWFRDQGAELRTLWHEGGHSIEPSEIAAAHEILTSPS